MMTWAPSELFITPDARTSQNKACLYKDKNTYITVDYMEIDKYLDEGYRRAPMDFDEEEVEPTPKKKTDDLKVKIDHLKCKIATKEAEINHLLDEKIQKKRNSDLI